MKGKYIALFLAGIFVAAAGIFFATQLGTTGMTLLTMAGLLVCAAGLEGLLPKHCCPGCGHRFRLPRYRRIGPGPEDTFPCPKCGIMVPIR